MLLSKSIDSKKRRTRLSKAFRRRHEDVGPDHASLTGAPSCPNCGVPQSNLFKALQWEQRLVGRLIEEQDAFKQSLADEIYEGFNQQLIGALMHLQSVERLQRENPVAASETLSAGLDLLRDTLDEARRIANRLRTPVLDDFGISEGIDQLIYELRHVGGPEIGFLRCGDLESIAPRIKNCAYRVVQELLRNACHHSGRGRVSVEIVRDERWLRIKIDDFGVGFDPRTATDDYFGLRKIRERVRLLGGRAIVHSEPSQGTRILVEIPVADARP
jgi:signal transduction histidine kinase